MILTKETLMAGSGCTPLLADRWLTHLQHVCKVYGIDVPKRLAAFLSQIGHESGRLVYKKELWGPTVAQVRYEGRRDLGNNITKDGKRYMGRNLIQITGRTNYGYVRNGLRKIMTKVPDFVAFPEELEKLPFATLSTTWYWDKHGLNAQADVGNFETITRRINGDLNDYDDRVMLYKTAPKALT